jgi:TonB family protein
MGSQIGAAAGWGGLGTVGTGSGGGGTNDHLVGLGNGLKIGTGDGPGGLNRGYGRMVGTLGNRHPIGPEIMPGIASVHGSLDKEIIRRIVRRHVNEVRYCYEQELTKRPALAGRIVVQFMIAGNGQVLSSVLQSSTMGNARVESCAVQAVHRWSFPEPQGGGLVTVTYPFSLTPAGS